MSAIGSNCDVMTTTDAMTRYNCSVPTMVAGSLAQAYAACEALARSHYENFPVASMLLPREMRPHVAAVYAFARSRGRHGRRRRRRAGRYGAPRSTTGCAGCIAAVESRGGVRRGDDLMLMATANSIRTLELPLQLFDDLVSAFAQDTTTTRYDSWNDVLDYCRRSANPVGRLVLRIAGYRDAALDRSSDALCTALQLTNFWQDVGRDWRTGRLYVPTRSSAVARRERTTTRRRHADRRLGARDRACVAFTRERFVEGSAVCDGVARAAAVGSFASRGSAARGFSSASNMDASRCCGSVRHWARGICRSWRCVLRSGPNRGRGVKAMARKTSFYYSFLVLPADQRRAIEAVWDFCRAIDDAVDEPDASAGDCHRASREAVAFWRAELARCYEGGEPKTSQGRELQPFITRLDLPRQAFDDVIDGVAMDLDIVAVSDLRRPVRVLPPRRVRGRSHLHPSLRLPESGARPSTRSNLGVALQLTNILRDIPGDLARGRVYIPLDDLAACGCHGQRPGGRGRDRCRPTAARVRMRRAHATSTGGPSTARPEEESPAAGRRRNHAGRVFRDAAFASSGAATTSSTGASSCDGPLN